MYVCMYIFSAQINLIVSLLIVLSLSDWTSKLFVMEKHCHLVIETGIGYYWDTFN